MPSTPWDVDLWVAGTVDGEAVNCKFQYRTSETGLTEVWVHRDGDTVRQSTTSRSPDIAQMAGHVIRELHAARAASPAADLAPSTSGGCQITSLHDYLYRVPLDSEVSLGLPAADRAAGQSS
jgi:hypothetical protein